jgi:hypothetical protein
LSNKKTKRKTVNQALEEFIRRRKQKAILAYFGKIEFDKKYNYKSERALEGGTNHTGCRSPV